MSNFVLYHDDPFPVRFMMEVRVRTLIQETAGIPFPRVWQVKGSLLSQSLEVEVGIWLKLNAVDCAVLSCCCWHCCCWYSNRSRLPCTRNRIRDRSRRRSMRHSTGPSSPPYRKEEIPNGDQSLGQESVNSNNSTPWIVE